MARRRGMEPMHDEHVNVTPLIDVIMCLIIFFLVAGHLAKSEANQKIVIPRAADGQEMADQEGRLQINIVPLSMVNAPAGDSTAAGAGASEFQDHPNPNAEPDVFIRGKPVDMNKLADYLRNEKRSTPDMKVIVRADQSVPYEWIAPVLVACAQADIKSVNFSTKVD